MGKSWSSPQCSLCRRNGTGRESLVLLLRWSGQERRSRNRTRAIKLPPLGAGGVADERATTPRQDEAKDFKKFSQMKLQMKREAAVKMNRQASEMPFMQICTTYFGLLSEQWALGRKSQIRGVKNS